MQLILIRHGQSEGNAGLSKEPDCPLTPLGIEQARGVAHRLAQCDLSGFVGLVSPYQRARRTAGEIAQRAGVEFTIDESIREWAGPATIGGKTYDAETADQLVNRMAEFLSLRRSQNLIIVSHGAPISVLMQLAWGETPYTQGAFWEPIPNASLRWLRAV